MTAKQPLAYSMRRPLTGCAFNFNPRNWRFGYLFQDRYKSVMCEDDRYLLELTRYAHL